MVRSMKEINRILIYHIGHLGDTICAIPAMAAIRERFPTARITLLTNKEDKGYPDPQEILSGNKFLDDIIAYPPKRIREPKIFWNLFRSIWSMKVDLLIYLPNYRIKISRLIRDRYFFRIAGCRQLIGFNLPKASRIYWENGNEMIVYPQEVDRLMELLSPLGIDPTKVDFLLPIKEEDHQKVEAIWQHYQLSNKFPIISMFPGAKFPLNRWSPENFSEVAAILQRDFGARILLIGGRSEIPVGEEISKSLNNSVINLIGQTSYMETIEVIRRCLLLISNDSGPVHLAAAVGTPVVGIYSSRNYLGAWHPWGEYHTILRNDQIHCRFCQREECDTMECIRSITVEQVITACARYLNKYSK